jgi:adenylate cyclase
MDFCSWLLSVDSRSMSSKELGEELGSRLCSIGIPVNYFSFLVLTMHPELLAESLVWNSDAGAQVFKRDQSLIKTESYLNSPVYRIFQGLGVFRQRLTANETEFDFPILHDLRESGHTDYMIEPLPLTQTQTSYVAWSTKIQGGFTDDHINNLKKLTPFLASAVALLSERNALKGLLETYLGHHAEKRVHSGLFHRGDGTSIDAVIWFSDLRGFTEFADKHTAEETLARLNAAFDIIGTAIYNCGGDILKFIGDAVLAVFPIGDGVSAETAANSAINAAIETQSALKKWSAEHQKPMSVGIALHRGEVHFGNIGSKSRLDFTVIGAPVNETSRIESMCKALGENILVSDAVAHLVEGRSFRNLGLQTLRGVEIPRTLYSL